MGFWYAKKKIGCLERRICLGVLLARRSAPPPTPLQCVPGPHFCSRPRLVAPTPGRGPLIRSSSVAYHPSHAPMPIQKPQAPRSRRRRTFLCAGPGPGDHHQRFTRGWVWQSLAMRFALRRVMPICFAAVPPVPPSVREGYSGRGGGRGPTHVTSTPPPPSVGTQCRQVPSENSKQCIHPEVPTGTLTQPLWQAPSPPPLPTPSDVSPQGWFSVDEREKDLFFGGGGNRPITGPGGWGLAAVLRGGSPTRSPHGGSRTPAWKICGEGGAGGCT